MFLIAAVLLSGAHTATSTQTGRPSLKINAKQQLVTQGIYGTIRHPMYASQLLWGIAQALLLQNWIAGPASLAAFLPLYLVRVPREERMMPII